MRPIFRRRLVAVVRISTPMWRGGQVAQYGSAAKWRSDAAGVLSATGPRFLWLLVEAAQPDDLTTPPISMQEQIDRLRGYVI